VLRTSRNARPGGGRSQVFVAKCCDRSQQQLCQQQLCQQQEQQPQQSWPQRLAATSLAVLMTVNPASGGGAAAALEMAHDAPPGTAAAQ
jgi:hypothetical protein